MSDSLLPIGTRVLETQASRMKHGPQSQGTIGRIIDHLVTLQAPWVSDDTTRYVYRVFWANGVGNSYREIDVRPLRSPEQILKLKEDV